MTKTFKSILVLVVAFMLTLTLTGCASSVAGKTYVYDSFEYELAVTAVKKVYENIELTFNEDGTCTLGKYTQDGSKLTIGDTEYKVSGSKITLKIEEANYSVKVVLKVKK